MEEQFNYKASLRVPVSNHQNALYIIESLKADQEPKGNSERNLSADDNIIVIEIATGTTKLLRICINSILEQIMHCEEVINEFQLN